MLLDCLSTEDGGGRFPAIIPERQERLIDVVTEHRPGHLRLGLKARLEGLVGSVGQNRFCVEHFPVLKGS